MGSEWFHDVMILIIIGFDVFLKGAVIVQTIQYDDSWILAIGSICSVTFGILCCMHTFLANPGIPDKIFTRVKNGETVDPLPTKEEDWAKYCQKCELMNVSKHTYSHCSSCGVCVENEDHHCAIFGKCIARNNQITFYLSMVMAVVCGA